MRKDLMDILVCPACKGQLTLTIENETNNDVETGTMPVSYTHLTLPTNREV